MMTTKIDKVVEFRKTLKAPVEKVFDTWTNPTELPKWFGCEGSKLKVTQDLRVGGEYRYDVVTAEGKKVTMSGKFLEVIVPSKLVYSWNNNSEEYPAKDSLVTVEFIFKGGNTEIILKHSKFDVLASVQGHTMGWGAAFDKLASLFAK